MYLLIIYFIYKGIFMKNLFSILFFVVAAFFLRYLNSINLDFFENVILVRILKGVIYYFLVFASLFPVFLYLNSNFLKVTGDALNYGFFGLLRYLFSVIFILLSLMYLPFVLEVAWNSIIAFKLVNFGLYLFLLASIALGVLISVRSLFRETFSIKYNSNIFFLSYNFLFKSFVACSMVPTVMVCYFFSVKIKSAISMENFLDTIMYVSLDLPFVFLLFYLIKKFNEAKSLFDSDDGGVSVVSTAEDIADAASERMKDFIN